MHEASKGDYGQSKLHAWLSLVEGFFRNRETGLGRLRHTAFTDSSKACEKVRAPLKIPLRYSTANGFEFHR